MASSDMPPLPSSGNSTAAEMFRLGFLLGRDATRVEMWAHEVGLQSHRPATPGLNEDLRKQIGAGAEELSTALDREPPEIAAVRAALRNLAASLQAASEPGRITNERLRNGVAVSATLATIQGKDQAMPGRSR
ncbi:hypothetical protein [Oleiharenicola sp. Vm1]|uniref:hypothetical protein n=1 Tax=Oleiharenicola sp. Vm1 TaxID=3398393 RepID=UPI0039F60407